MGHSRSNFIFSVASTCFEAPAGFPKQQMRKKKNNNNTKVHAHVTHRARDTACGKILNNFFH